MNRLIDMARIHMTMVVAISAMACETGGIRIRNGGDPMNWSQNSTPARKRLAYIRQMCTAWLFCARSNNDGACQASITTLNAATATQGRSSQPTIARSGRDQPPHSTPAVALRPARPGRPSGSGCHGARPRSWSARRT